MRDQVIVRLAEGTIISVWPANTGGGGEINVLVEPPFVVPATGRYLVDTDSGERTVRFRLAAEPGAAS